MPANCRSCGAPIFWALTDRNKRMPVDVKPVDDGNVEITGQRGPLDEQPGVFTVRVLKNGDHDVLPGLETPERFLSHFATCPNAADHRGNRHFRKDDD